MEDFIAQTKKAFSKQKRTHTLLVIALLIFCLLELHALARDLHEAYLVNSDASVEIGHFRDEKNATPEEIQSWMTFDYINTIFKLPDTYLKTRLNIGDSNYPRMRIGRAAREAHVDRNDYLTVLRAAVAAYGHE